MKEEPRACRPGPVFAQLTQAGDPRRANSKGENLMGTALDRGHRIKPVECFSQPAPLPIAWKPRQGHKGDQASGAEVFNRWGVPTNLLPSLGEQTAARPRKTVKSSESTWQVRTKLTRLASTA